MLAAQGIQVGRRAVEQEPADADAGGVAGDPLEPLGHARVDQQRGGALRLRRVDQAEDLLDLPHCVVLREQDLDVGRQPLGGRARVLAQERLVLLLGAREADDDALVHPHRAYTAHMTARPGLPPAMCDAPASKQRTIVRVTAAARLLEDPPGEAALARLRRCGFDEPERAARELRLVASHPPLGPALQKTMGSLLGSLARLPDALGALVRLERFARGDEALTLRKLLERGPRARQALLWALGGSPFLAEQVIRHPEWAEWLTRPRVLASAPGARVIAAEARRLVAGRAPAAARDALRLLRRREVLRIAIRDLLRLTPVTGTLASLSALADGLVGAALEVAAGELGEPPARSTAAPSTPGFSVLGLGKLGGGELNFSSDVDLVYVHRDAGREAAPAARCRALSRARRLTAVLAHVDRRRLVYRVDLRLRPEGRAGRSSNSLPSRGPSTTPAVADLGAARAAQGAGRSPATAGSPRAAAQAGALRLRTPAGEADASRICSGMKPQIDRRLAARAEKRST